MILKNNYRCPECDCKLGFKLVMTRFNWTPIVCPNCKKPFQINAKSMRLLITKFLIYYGLMIIVTSYSFSLNSQNKVLLIYLSCFSLSTCILILFWYFYSLNTKLIFEPITQKDELKMKLLKATFIGFFVSLCPLLIGTLIMAVIDDESGPKHPYDMIHGGLTALCFYLCAFLSSTLTYNYLKETTTESKLI